jgi:hypothetical protein
LSARLRVGSDATGIVVCDASDKPWSDPCQGMLFQTRPKEAQDLRMSRRIGLILFEVHALYGGLSVGAQKGHAIITDRQSNWHHPFAIARVR